MAGHSKWANIKHKKGRADQKRGKLFSRIAKEVISAVKVGGADPRANPRLRLAIQKARAANVPKENIDRNIKKAMSADQADFTELTYELYGHGGVGVLVEVMTDNKNRTASDIHIATMKKGGSLAGQGSVAFNFDRKGVIQVDKKHALEDELFSVATESGAEDFDQEDDTFIITCDPTDFLTVKEAIEAKGIQVDEASVEMIPKVSVECDEKTAKANLALIEWLEELDDVDAVYHNMS